MDKFLEIVCLGQFDENGFSDKYMEFYKPTLDLLKGILSEAMYSKVEEQFIEDSCNNKRFYSVEAMKLAIGIMNGTYVPSIQEVRA